MKKEKKVKSKKKITGSIELDSNSFLEISNLNTYIRIIDDNYIDSIKIKSLHTSEDFSNNNFESCYFINC